jgi:branched-chain amino acid transport system permease protein
MDNLFFNSTTIMGDSETLSVGRPDIFGITFGSNRAFTILVALVLAVCIVGIGALRRSVFGRRLVGMNDSPAACATAGLNLTATKLIVFTLSAGLAGLAGALFGGIEQSVDADQFQFLLSLAFFLAVTLAGISSLSGPIMGAVFLAVVPVIADHVGVPELLYLGAGAGAISIGFFPNGIAGNHAKVAELWRRRRQVPTKGSSPVLPVGTSMEGSGMKSVG